MSPDRLSDAQIRRSEPSDKLQKLSDGRGLFLLLRPDGARYWRFRYRYGRKEKQLSLGVYPEISLKEARSARDDARRLLKQGIDPSVARREKKAALEQKRRAAELEEKRLAAESLPAPRVTLQVDGTVELWRGKTVLRMNKVQMRELRDLFNQLLDGA